MDRNQLYLDNPHPWGVDYLPLVPEFCKLLPQNSTVLDLASGDGRNSLFIARSGFKVKAVDFSERALEVLSITAHNENLPIEAQLADLRRYRIVTNYGGVCCNFALHFLQPKIASDLLIEAQSRTIDGGVHFITDFLPNHASKIGVFSADEILELYSDWEIISFDILPEEVTFQDEFLDKYHDAFYLIARKKITL